MLFAESSSLFDSQGFSAILGAVFAVIAVFLGQELQKRYQLKKELKEYVAVLQSTCHELRFYRDKFSQLSIQLLSIAHHLQTGERDKIVCPSYDLHGSFLEAMKTTIAAYGRTPSIIQNLINCHFELSHIANRIELTRHELSNNSISTSVPFRINARNNTLGFEHLVKLNVATFDSAVDAFDREIAKSESELSDFDFHHPPFSA